MAPENPYEPPRSTVAAAAARLPPPLYFLVLTQLGLKALQLVVTVWLLTRGAAVVWSLLDVVIHVGAGVLLLNGRRIAIAPLLFAAAIGVLFSMRPNGDLIPARVMYLVGLPLVLALVTARHWRSWP